MTNHGLNISAVIPAAGMSTRMHGYKPLLELGSHTIIEKAILLLKHCNIDDIIVVTGYNHEKIEPVIKKTGARAVFNPDFKSGMFSSVKAGVRALSLPSIQTDGFFLLPADIPLVRPSTINALVSSFMENPDKIIIPEFLCESLYKFHYSLCLRGHSRYSESGHPPLIPSWLISEILCSCDEINLGTLLLDKQQHQKRVVVYDRGILMDADTKEDYEKLIERHNNFDIPDIFECQAIIEDSLKGEEIIKKHLHLAAKTAVKLAQAAISNEVAKKNFSNININLVMAGALLHDIRKKEKNHADAGGKFLLSLGFPEVARIVFQHTDLNEPLPETLTETEIVYFADKLCNGIVLDLDYPKRFKEKIVKIPIAENAILRRYENTRLIHSKIEAASGRTLASILSSK